MIKTVPWISFSGANPLMLMTAGRALGNTITCHSWFNTIIRRQHNHGPDVPVGGNSQPAPPLLFITGSARTCTHVCMHTHTCVHTHMQACMHTYMHKHRHACMHTHRCTCTHKPACMHTHTHRGMHTHTHTWHRRQNVWRVCMHACLRLCVHRT